MDYQFNYTENPVAKNNMYDGAARAVKAKKILAVLSCHLADLHNMSLLDVSCSTGIMSGHLSDSFSKVHGIDIDEKAIAFAKQNNNKNNVEFHVMDALNMSFPDNSFDVVVCNQMYEHVPDVGKLMDEIQRVLVPGGVCYFGATNRLKVVETHYGRLPFLSYFPKPVANIYLRLTGRGQYYYENLYTYWTLKRVCGNFKRVDYTAKVIGQPDRFSLEETILPGSLKQRVALLLLKYMYWFSPGYIWLLEKPLSPPEAGEPIS